jgi:nucleosome binding factor SPN SPT16 subunit
MHPHPLPSAYTHTRNQQVVDVMYSNIRNAIFQPCYQDLNVIIHFHLKDPIMINKKKAHDVQFYTEVVESVINMEGTRRSTYDPDEIEEEQRERVLKKRLNDLFKDFAQRVQAVAQAHDHALEFDAPYRDLAFTGTPHREMVTVHFSAQCILSVSEAPFFVVPLDDIEHVHFERVTPSAKNFDMIIVQKDLEKEPLTINSIPREHFVKIEQTLLDVEVTFTYGVQSWKWKEVLAGVKEDDHFYDEVDQDGEAKDPGWAIFLPKEAGEGDSDESEEDEDSEFEAESEVRRRGVVACLLGWVVRWLLAWLVGWLGGCLLGCVWGGRGKEN